MIRLECTQCGVFAELDDYKPTQRTALSGGWVERFVQCRCGNVRATEINEVADSPATDDERS